MARLVMQSVGDGPYWDDFVWDESHWDGTLQGCTSDASLLVKSRVGVSAVLEVVSSAIPIDGIYRLSLGAPLEGPRPSILIHYTNRLALSTSLERPDLIGQFKVLWHLKVSATLDSATSKAKINLCGRSSIASELDKIATGFELRPTGRLYALRVLPSCGSYALLRGRLRVRVSPSLSGVSSSIAFKSLPRIPLAGQLENRPIPLITQFTSSGLPAAPPKKSRPLPMRQS